MAEVGGWMAVIAICVFWFGGCIWVGIAAWRDDLRVVSSVAVVAAVFGMGFCLMGYREAYPPNGVAVHQIREDRWACTATRQEHTTTYVKSGSVMVPVTTTRNICTQWNEH